MSLPGRSRMTAEGKCSCATCAFRRARTLTVARPTLRQDGTRPRVSAQIALPVLDLRGMGGGGSDARAADGWSRDPIDASALGALDGDISLAVDGIARDSGTFGPIRLRSRSTMRAR